MQLVAYGAQDIYLTGNPQITFFKVVYRRHTNFSMETIQQTINGASTTDGGSGTVTISRNGDLVHKVYVTSDGANINNGDEIVNEVELEIGGQRIDRHYKQWSQIWNELSTDESKAIGLKAMKGSIGISKDTGVGLVQVPLNFWFCRNPGLALPLIALQYHEVKLKFTWGTKAAVTSDTTAVTCQVWCDYIYLDTDERRRFAQVSHEYLIEQLQREEKTQDDTTHKLNFNHPVKELIWTGDGYVNAQIKLNGHDRFAVQEEEYFQLRQPYEYHTAVPKQNLPSAAQSTLQDRGVLIESLATASGTSLGTKPYAGAGGAVDSPEEAVYNATTNTLTLQSSASTLTTALAPGDQLIINIASGVGSLPANIIVGDYLGTVKTAVPVTADFSTAGGQDIVFKSDPVSLQDNSTALAALAVSQAANTFSLNMVGKLNVGTNQARTSQLTGKINVYSFALKPEEHQPSGTCNFSRIDNAELKFSQASPVEAVTVYAVNYNVLRIMSGMGGLAYSN